MESCRKKKPLRLLQVTLIIIFQCAGLFIIGTNGLRNNVFGSLNPQQLLPNNTFVTATTNTTPTPTATTITTTFTTAPSVLPLNLAEAALSAFTGTSTISPSSQTAQGLGAGSVLNQVFKKVSLEEINKSIRDIMQKESSNSNFGQCLFTGNPYLDLGYRETNYVKCKQFLLSAETWLDDTAINSKIQELLPTQKLSIPSKKKFAVPPLEVLFKETFLQVCVNFFINLVNSGQLYIGDKVCTGTACHDQLNLVCGSVNETYGKSASVLGSACVSEVVGKICQESRRQLSLKYPTLIASPGDIRPDNIAVEPVEPVPT